MDGQRDVMEFSYRIRILQRPSNLYHNLYHRWPAPTSADSVKSP